MGSYRVNHNYKSPPHHFEADSVVELEDEVAEWVNRDSPGCLTREDDAAEADSEPSDPEPAGDGEEGDGESTDPEPHEDAAEAETEPAAPEPAPAKPSRRRSKAS